MNTGNDQTPENFWGEQNSRNYLIETKEVFVLVGFYFAKFFKYEKNDFLEYCSEVQDMV